MLKGYTDRFTGEIAELRSATKARWDENERPFSEDEIEAFSQKFKLAGEGLLAERASAFRSEAWSSKATEPTRTMSTETPSNAAERTAFVRPILDRKGWTESQWAAKAGVDKNTVRDYLNGITRKLRPSNRRAMAEALEVDVAQMPR